MGTANPDSPILKETTFSEIRSAIRGVAFKKMRFLFRSHESGFALQIRCLLCNEVELQASTNSEGEDYCLRFPAYGNAPMPSGSIN